MEVVGEDAMFADTVGLCTPQCLQLPWHGKLQWES